VVAAVRPAALPRAQDLLIWAEGGGSNGSRSRAWKFYLQDLATRAALRITVRHFPPGTSKWNKMEHRMVSFINLNWRGQPLISYEAVVNPIGRTTTRTGLKIAARLDTRASDPGVNLSHQEMVQFQLTALSPHLQWNYTIGPIRVRGR